MKVLILIFFPVALFLSAAVSEAKMKDKIHPVLLGYMETAQRYFGKISPERKAALEKITNYIHFKKKQNDTAKFTFICTHNSRRSHMAQLWANAAAAFYEVEPVECFSGGTEATAFNPRAVAALERAGFKIQKNDDGENPVYDVTFMKNADTIRAFSKKYEHESNPKEDFAAVMVCSQADEACPFVAGAGERISLPFDDPKEFDGTDRETEKYDERCLQICVEIMWAFKSVSE